VPPWILVDFPEIRHCCSYLTVEPVASFDREPLAKQLVLLRQVLQMRGDYLKSRFFTERNEVIP
jgi:hypothetical protein